VPCAAGGMGFLRDRSEFCDLEAEPLARPSADIEQASYRFLESLMKERTKRSSGHKKKWLTVNDRMQKGYRYELSAPVGRNFDPEFKPQLTTCGNARSRCVLRQVHDEHAVSRQIPRCAGTN
jgi:hypothetical protein